MKTNEIVTPKMENAAVINAANSCLKAYKSISGIASHRAEISAKYGKDNFKAIKAAAQQIKAGAIDRAAAGVMSALDYTAVLNKAFSIVSGKAEFKTLAKYAGTTYGKDAAAAVVKDFYTAVDAAGAPVKLVRIIDVQKALVYAGYIAKELTAVDGVKILETALSNMGKTLKKAANRAKDAGAIKADNVKDAGKISAVYCFDCSGLGIIKVDPKAGDKKPENCTITGTAAAAIIGHSLPSVGADFLSYGDYIKELRTAEREQNAKDAAAYRAAQRAGLLKDAKAAGVKTKLAAGAVA